MAHYTTAHAGSFVVGNTYTIAYVGTTNWVAIGASSNTSGVEFVATGIGSGTGTATYNILNYKLAGDIQSLQPSALIELFELDTTNYSGGQVFRFHAGVNELERAIVWQGATYNPYPIEASGFETNGTGASPRPRVLISNIGGLVGYLGVSFSDLVGCKLTRKRTLLKYLDEVNFASGTNPTADPNAHFPDEIFFIDRKSKENKLQVEFELASILDMNGVVLPRRQVIQNTCSWKYRSAECGYTGGPAADRNDVKCASLGGTAPDDNDKCGKRLVSCEIRFGYNQPLPFGAFPAVGLIR